MIIILYIFKVLKRINLYDSKKGLKMKELLEKSVRGKTEYYYDSEGRLVWKKIHISNGGKNNKVLETWYYYNHHGELIETKQFTSYIKKPEPIEYCLWEGYNSFNMGELLGSGYDDTIIYSDLLHDALLDALSTLKPREADVVCMHHALNGGREYSFTEIGKKYDISGSCASQIYHRALRKMSQPIISKKIKDFIY